ncbi:MAG: hypothetical protein H6732_09815 [Alphaproteobacteria bacterium]|nr:hypothetical protein [Alphaproteobacteria bacterium]
MVWIAPASRTILPSRWLTVMPTRALRDWIRQEGADQVRLLRGLGLRRGLRPPRRPWIVAVFEPAAGALCRPTDEVEPGTQLAGSRVCDRGARGIGLHDEGCGYAVDFTSHRRSLDVFRIRWRDAAARGFCVLPLARFLAGE